jgi:uncharacterized protein
MIRTPPPWLVAQRWEQFLFAHWPVARSQVAAHLPRGVEVDVREGTAWLSIVAFVMVGTRSCGPPWWPVLAPIPELNVRTYVRVDGQPAIWFLSLDATSTLFASVGRALYGMPYRTTPMSVAVERGAVRYDAPCFSATYAPSGPARTAEPGTLEHFLVERYRLYSRRRGRLVTAEVMHDPWRLSPAGAEIELNELAPAGVELVGDPILHFCAGVSAVISAPVRVASVVSDGTRLRQLRPDRPARPRHLVRAAGASGVPRDAA